MSFPTRLCQAWLQALEFKSGTLRFCVCERPPGGENKSEKALAYSLHFFLRFISLCLVTAMRPSLRLLQHTARITLFTRRSCSLCDKAKIVIGDVSKKRSFDYYEIDVMAPDQERWKLAYEFDAPVVSTTKIYTHWRPLI